MEEENPAVVENDQGDGSFKKVRHRKKQLYKSIRNQMEFYFSDANLTKDRFLGKLIMQDPYVNISVFLKFNRIQDLTTNLQDVTNALRDSELLSVTEDGTRVFRKTPVKEKDNTDDCTIYVEQLPPDAQHDWLRDVFSAYGKVAYVSLPKYRTSGKIKGFAFVEFDTPEEANKTLEAFGARGCRLSSQIAPEKLCSISTYDHDEGKSENVPSESDKKGTLHKINEDEDGQFQLKLSRKRRKRKKGKQEHGVELNIEKSDAVETEGETEGNICLKKCKREKIQEADGVKTEVEAGHSQPEDENTPPKKKKRKKTEVEGREGRMDMAYEDISNINQSETFLENKVKTEVGTEHSQPEDDNTPPKKKKRKKSEGSGVRGTEGKMYRAHEDISSVNQSEKFLEKKVKIEVETGHSQPEDENTPQKKKKRKKNEGSGFEGTEGKVDKDYEDTSSVNQSETFWGKKIKTAVEEETDVSELQQGMPDIELEDEVVGKKKIKSAQWNEGVDAETGIAEETAEAGAEVIVKKKTRKRKKKHKKDKQDVEASRLQILSKREWKRLRNKYLDLQRGKMKCLKQYLSRNWWNNNSQIHHHDQLQYASGQNQLKDDNGDESSETGTVVKEENEKKPKFTFTPGVIVHAVLDEPVSEVRKFKVDARALGEVEYVDVMQGSSEAFLRCSTPTAAELLVSNAPWQQVDILKGEDESHYWNKMLRDREQKLSNNVRVKQRGRDKILRRAERELALKMETVCSSKTWVYSQMTTQHSIQKTTITEKKASEASVSTFPVNATKVATLRKERAHLQQHSLKANASIMWFCKQTTPAA